MCGETIPMPGLAWSTMHLFVRVTKTGSGCRGRQHTHATTGCTGPNMIGFDNRYRLTRTYQLDGRDDAGLAATNNEGVAGIR